MTIREAINQAAERLSVSEHLRSDAQRDATLLLLHTLGIARAQLLADPDRILTPDQRERFEQLVARRLTHEPIQYITSEQEFFGLALRVTRAVLIPRPETEHLVEAVLAEVDGTAGPSVVDVGTGSGAIAIALAHHLRSAHITATDISPAALEVAAENAGRHRLAHRIRFVESDLLDSVAQHAPFDVIVSNPPYVPFAEGKNLHPQIRDFEPATALFATGSGLDIYRRLIPQANVALKPGGLLALEIGQGQQAALADLLSGWNAVRFIPDLQQIPRVALARKR
ncbi:MAG TPA: peptide chain release factor N(5)-glutamine methyltransferase [Acidobacteriaceae bacterium]|jgi:release factor glutamine methyltransferase|nr:peptide chain release factor N(5)-glutamine methyltransferase [Acidobacteriaceae bacterium]